MRRKHRWLFWLGIVHAPAAIALAWAWAALGVTVTDVMVARALILSFIGLVLIFVYGGLNDFSQEAFK